MKKNKNKLQFIPLGGMGEIGKNMYVYRYADEIVVVDAGQMFPDEEMFGIDSVIPDISYLIENKSKVKGIILTHGHEDHIGGLPYILQSLDVPIYGTKLTLGLVQAKLKDRSTGVEPEMHVISPEKGLHLGEFFIECIRVNHSIPDAVSFAIHTPAGTVIHTGDFKIDQTPIDGEVFDLQKFAAIGHRGVLLLVSDSTNAEKPGMTLSERYVGNAINDVFRTATGRILIATFASNVHRLQQVIDGARTYGRKIAIVGRSMVNVVAIAQELGYLDAPEGMLIDIDDINKLPKEKIAIITTGSQGEPMAALSRIAASSHRKIDIIPGDTVMIAASPIPGNERLVGRTINNLFKRGARVLYEKQAGIHVSGHASQEELKMMISLVRPKYFIPCHGEYRHLVKHAEIAKELGIPKENVFITENGMVMEFAQDKAGRCGSVTSGKVYVDGLGIGDVGNIVLRDRKHLSQDGILVVVLTMDKQNGTVVAGPDIISRGFVYVRESEMLLEDARVEVTTALDRCQSQNSTPVEWSVIKTIVRDSLGSFLYERTGRRPMILPIIMEI